MNSELLATLVLFLLSALPLWSLAGRARHWGLLILAAAAGAAVVMGVELSQSKGRVAARQRPERPVQIAEDGFVSSRSCRSCHPQEYSTWHASYHRTMTQVASAESVRGDFDDVSLSLQGHDFRLFQRDDKYWVEIREKGSGQKRSEHEIVMTTGSHHMQFYWYSSEGSRELGKLPFVFLFSEKRWVPADSTFLRPPTSVGWLAMGQWNQNCINCHSTHGKPGIEFASGELLRSEILAVNTRVAEFGIACEACHGPCEEHVRLNSNPLRRYALHLDRQADDSVIQPEKLTPQLSSQVCGQCHSIKLPKTKELVRKVMADGFEFRAGDDLFAADSQRVVVRKGQDAEAIKEAVQRDPTYFDTLFWSDGMVRIAGRDFNGLIESPCYQHQDEARGIMSCMSCHEMHPSADDARSLDSWADDQLKPGMRGDAACLQCHQDYRDDEALTAHTHHTLESAGSRCYNCHMPHTTYGLLKAIRSHTVSSPSVTESVLVNRPNACNLCHLDKTLSWTADQLKQRYGIDSPSLTEPQGRVAASILWTLQGDAGLRAVTAWHMGWEPARQVSGADWMPPYLALLMTDPYDAVRYVAYHALLKNPRFKQFRYDFMNQDDRNRALGDVTKVWAETDDRSSWITGDEFLIRADGTIMRDELSRLLQQRDQHPVLLNE